jgi:TRAP-type mannitol/chloroaromatic compound transport system substrate-binding protein
MNERMDRRLFLGTAASAAGAGLMAGCAPDSAANAPQGDLTGTVSGPEISWRLASSFPPSLDILHGGAVRLAERVSELTGGRFQIRVYAAGEIVPALQVMDAVQQGTVQAGFTASYYYIGKNAALAFDCAVPFGLSARQQNAWLYHGGGIDLMRSVYADFGIVQFPCGNTGAQMGGWFRRPIETLRDLQGLRMRLPGLAGEVMTRLGVSVQVLSGGDIYPALERGAIDATEWVGAYDDEKLGFYLIAPYYYVPGWWEPGESSTLQINQRAWDELPAGYKQVMESATREVNQDMLTRYDVENPKALKRLVEDHGVTLRAFSQEIMDAAWRESNAYLEDQAVGDAAFRSVYEQWKAFRETAFPYFAGTEMHYAAFAFPKIPGLTVQSGPLS